MGVFPSGQWGQTVNLLLFSFGGSNPPAPTKSASVAIRWRFFAYRPCCGRKAATKKRTADAVRFFVAPSAVAVAGEQRLLRDIVRILLGKIHKGADGFQMLGFRPVGDPVPPAHRGTVQHMKLCYPVEGPDCDCALMAMRGDFEPNIRFLRALGYDGIELIARDADLLRQGGLLQMLDRHRMPVLAISTAAISKQDGAALLHADPRLAREAFDRVAALLPLAQALGCPLCIGKVRGQLSDGGPAF